MSDPRIQGPLSILGVAIGDGINEAMARRQRRASIPAQQKNVGRAVLGAGVLAGCAYVVVFAEALLGEKFSLLVAEFQRAPHDPPFMLVAWLAALVFGAGYLWIGWRGAQDGPDAAFAAFCSVALPAGGGVLVALYAPGLLADPWGRGGCFVVAVMCAMRFWLATRAGGDAEAPVKRNIETKQAPLIAAKRRKF
jgi:apolipoprotein N-acyltransferase